MTSFFLTILKFLVAFKGGLRDPEFRALLILLVALLLSGTVFYTSAEQWAVVDSLYFSVSTLSTVGYGDLHPTTTLSKIFTIIYLVLGVGVFVAFITKVAQQRSERLRGIRDGGSAPRAEAADNAERPTPRR